MLQVINISSINHKNHVLDVNLVPLLLTLNKCLIFKQMSQCSCILILTNGMIFQLIIIRFSLGSEAVPRGCSVKKCSDKVADLRRAALLKETLALAKYVRTLFLQNTSDGCFCGLPNTVS